MDDALHSSLIERVVLDRAHLHKCLLCGRVVVSNQSAQAIGSLRGVLSKISQAVQSGSPA